MTTVAAVSRVDHHWLPPRASVAVLATGVSKIRKTGVELVQSSKIWQVEALIPSQED